MIVWKIISIAMFVLWSIAFVTILLSSRNEYKVTKFQYIVVALRDTNTYHEWHLDLNFKVKCNNTYALLKIELASQLECETNEVIILNYKYLGRKKI